MIDVSVLKAMAAKGATVEMIIAAVEAAQKAEVEKLADQREMARQRQIRRRQRLGVEKNKSEQNQRPRHAMSRDVTHVTRDNRDTPSPDKERSPHTPLKKLTPTPSEPKGSGAGAPKIDPVKVLWDLGVQILGERGRSTIGQARKTHDDGKIMDALMATERAKTGDPIPYFRSCLSGKTKRFVRPGADGKPFVRYAELPGTDEDLGAPYD